MAAVSSGSPHVAIEPACAADAPEVLECVNAAYAVEIGSEGVAFKTCNRYQDVTAVAADIAAAAAQQDRPQQFAVARRRGADGVATGPVIGCIRLEIWARDSETVCEFGPFAVMPSIQRGGVGTALLGHAAAFAKLHSATKFEIGVVNHRTDGLAWYAKQGFVEAGTKPFVGNFDVESLTRPCHFIVLTKDLGEL